MPCPSLWLRTELSCQHILKHIFKKPTWQKYRGFKISKVKFKEKRDMITKSHWHTFTNSIDESQTSDIKFSDPSLNFYNKTTFGKPTPPHFLLPKLILADSFPSSTGSCKKAQTFKLKIWWIMNSNLGTLFATNYYSNFTVTTKRLFHSLCYNDYEKIIVSKNFCY